MMPKDYEAAAKQIAAHHGACGASRGVDIAVEVARACYALTQKPQRELTDAEIQREWGADNSFDTRPLTPLGIAAVKRILMAHQRKQQEPETVKFRAARFKDTCNVIMERADWKLSSDKEWLPGEPQEIEVKLP